MSSLAAWWQLGTVRERRSSRSGATYPVPFVPGPKPFVLGPKDQGDQGLTVQDSVETTRLVEGAFVVQERLVSIRLRLLNRRLPYK